MQFVGPQFGSLPMADRSDRWIGPGGLEACSRMCGQSGLVIGPFVPVHLSSLSLRSSSYCLTPFTPYPILPPPPVLAPLPLLLSFTPKSSLRTLTPTLLQLLYHSLQPPLYPFPPNPPSLLNQSPSSHLSRKQPAGITCLIPLHDNRPNTP